MSVRPAPAAKAALDQATKRWPARSRASDGIVGDAAHRRKKSDHNPDADGYACAFDLTHDPGNGVDAHALVEELRRRREPRVKYIISRGRIASPPGWEWRRYTGANPHDKHAHVSITQAGKMDTSPWWHTAAPPSPARQEEGEDMAKPVDALHDPWGESSDSVWVLTADGAIWAYHGARYLGGANGQAYWAGREAKELRVNDRGGYDILATSGERYSYPA